MNITVSGVKELQALMAKMPDKTNSAVKKELNDICADLQGKAQRLAPVDTGDLRGSAFFEVEGLDGTVGFTEPYALRQHEAVEFSHPKGGQAKYLEEPYKENSDKYVDALKKAVKGAVT